MYGLMILVGAVAGIGLALLRAKKYQQKREDVLFSAFFAGIGVAVGAKILYIITILPDLIANWNTLVQNTEYLFSIISGGFVFYGGLIGAVIMLVIYTRKYRLDTFTMLEVFAPAIPLVHAFGRLGCFCAGCCYGIPVDPPLGMVFAHSVAGPQDVPLLPIQLFESGLNIVLCVVLLSLSRKINKRGRLLGIYLIAYAVMRFVLEFFRYDYVRGFLLGISTSQWISILLIPIGILFIVLPRDHKLFQFFDFSRLPKKE